MPFLHGSVSFSRFRVVGGSPKRLDEHLLDKLRGHAIGKSRVAKSSGEETGWIGGRHLLDREFDVDKNVILDCLHFGLRIDQHRVPPELFRAYVQQELDALRSKSADVNGRGFAKLKKQAHEAATARAREEIGQGRFLASRQFPLLLDTRNDCLYVGATQPAVIERLLPLFRETFDRRLEPLTAGRVAYGWGEKKGVQRKIENARPAATIPHPDGNGHNGEVYWTRNDPASRDFLGNEFLLWLWHSLAEEGDTISLSGGRETSLMLTKQLLLECPWAEFGRVLVSAAGPTALAESRAAIRSGKLPRRAGFILSVDGDQYEFALNAETLAVSSAALPAIEFSGDGRARVEERVEQVRGLARVIDELFETYLAQRFGSEWEDSLSRMRAWIEVPSRAMAAGRVA